MHYVSTVTLQQATILIPLCQSINHPKRLRY